MVPTTASTIGKELIFDIPNRPGELRKITKTLSGAGINIAGITAIGLGSTSSVRIVPESVEPAIQALKQARIPFTTRDVLTLSVPNVPGELDRRLAKVVDSGINIECLFPTVTKAGAALTFEVDNPHKLGELLR